MATKNELRIRAREVKNETELGHNTANRIGDLFYDVVNKLLDETPYTKKEVQDKGTLYTNKKFSLFLCNNKSIYISETINTSKIKNLCPKEK